MTDQTKRRKAHEALDRLLDAEVLIGKTSDPNDRERIAWERYEDFKVNLRFSLVEKYAIAVNAPAEVNADDIEFSIEAKREMIAGAITWGIPLPDGDALELGDALRALNSGQTMKIVRPTTNSSREKAWQIQCLQLYAVMGSYFLHGTGIGMAESRNTIANFFGLSSGENIRTWERRDLVNSLGEEGGDRLELMCDIARLSGELFNSGAPQPPGFPVVFGNKENALRSMKECGIAYQSALQKKEFDIPIIYFN